MGLDWGLFLDSAIKLAAAGILGGVIGWERESKQRPAGIRTHMLVCAGATLICIVSAKFVPGTRVADPARIAAQIVSGIGFLGAGTIMRQGNIVVGLTTAASLWTVAAIGMAVSLGGTFYLIAAFATVMMWVALIVMRRIEKAMGHEVGNDIAIEAHACKEDVDELLALIRCTGVALGSLSMSQGVHPNEVAISLHGEVSRGATPAEITQTLMSDVRVSKVKWATTRYRPSTRWVRTERDDAHGE